MSSELDTEDGTGKILKRAKFFGILDVGSGNCQADDVSEHEQTDEERLSEQVFSIPLILKEILKYLDIDDLLGTSLVNKSWNFFSREVLRDNKNCLAIVDRTNFCHSLKDLNAVLLWSETVPFSGISAALTCYQCHQCLVPADLSAIMNNILKKINFKYLLLEFNLPRVDSDCIIALDCVGEIFAEKASGLERLSFDLPRCLLSKTFSEYIGLDLQGQWLPNVRVLEFNKYCPPRMMLKELIGASPQLQQLNGSIDSQSLDIIITLKAVRAVNDLDFRPTIESLRHCAAFCLENPKLEKLTFSTADQDHRGEISFSDWSEFHQNEVSRIVKQLIISSQESIKTVTCDYYDLILLTFQWNIPVLKKVTHLILKYNVNIDDEVGYSPLNKIEWAKYFPNLEEVCLTHPIRHNVKKDFYIDQVFRESNVEFVCESVKIFRWMSSDLGKIQMFKKHFPNVKEFYLNDCREFRAVLNELWTAWLDLEVISTSVDMDGWIPNYDSAFLGVTEEEADYLQEHVELESLEIVSTSPCIFNLRKLKKLVMHLYHDEDLCLVNRSAPDTVFLSRLTGQCVFSRVPTLVVEVYGNLCEPTHNCQFALNHIKPFVKCVENCLQ